VTKYVLDTSLYIRAFRSEKGKQELQAYYDRFTPSTYLSSIVAHELLVGANTEAKARDIHREVLGPLRRVGRLVTPSHAAWEESGEALSRMARKAKRDLRSIPKSLVHDFLLAASCRESGTTLITENTADFREIGRFIRFAFEKPWPR
jgi:predicted nucleic acid-binding protein